MARILILIGSHLCTAPRPQKEAAALAEAGHEVTVAGGWFDPGFAALDEQLTAGARYRFVRADDLRPTSAGGRARRWISRLAGYFVRRRFARDGRFAPELLGLFARKHLQLAREIRADLTIAHAEGGLWVASELQKDGGRVGVDLEDWFSEDLLPADRVHRPLAKLRDLEAGLLRSSAYTLTTSRVLAAALARAYAAPAPAVVYNAFPEAPLDGRRVDRPQPGVPSLHWFSQTIGPGRGLELLFQALPRLRHDYEVSLRGHLPARYRTWLDGLVPAGWRERLRILPWVPGPELPSRIAEHDVGLSLEQGDNPSRDHAIGNKFFQYLQAGLAVVATDTQGQQEAVHQAPEACRLVPQRDAGVVAAALDDLVRDPTRLAAVKAAARRAAQTVFAWEKQRNVLLSRASDALTRSA